MLGSLAAPSFLGSCTGNGADQATGISFAQNHFGVSESDMKKVLTAALEKGGEKMHKRGKKQGVHGIIKTTWPEFIQFV